MSFQRSATEDLAIEQLRAIGLGYNYTALKEQVSTVILEVCQKVLPFDDEEPQSFTTNPRTPSGRPRYSIDTTCAIQLDESLHNLAKEHALAKAAVEKAVAVVQQAKDLSKLVDLYVQTLDVIKAALEAGPDPKEVPPPVSVRHNSVPSRSGAKESASRRVTDAPASTTVGWKQAANNAISQAQRAKTTKSKSIKVPPPKPDPRPVTEEEFESVSMLVRGRAKLVDVNKAYNVLYEAFCTENLEKIKLSEVVKRGVPVSGMTEKAKFKDR